MANSENEYDVFLSYQWRDREAVESLALALRDRGIKPFLDRWYLVPGRPWPEALEYVLNNCRATAVIVGDAGLGSWQQREKSLALDRQAADPTFPVIPVLLAGAEPALGFLGLNTWVDLRHGIRDDHGIDVLAGAIEGRAPGVDGGEADSAQRVCPYRGLRAFREEDAEFFSGREAYTARLGKAVNSESFVAVVGASGSGKSSIVKAGLFPELRSQSGKIVWELQSVVPGGQPLQALAAVLVPILEPNLSRVDRRIEVNKLAKHLASGDVSLVDIIVDVLQAQPGTERLLLFIDQWEELYTLCHDDSERSAFVTAVLDASERTPTSVVIAMRADFFVHALKDRRLADALQNHVINLGPMTSEELKRSITLPAEKLNLRFESGLVDRMMKDVGDEPGNLPLLEFVLTALWEKRHAGMMHHDAYDEIGGIEGAIANRAEEIIDRLSPQAQDSARRVLIQMVQPGEGTEDTRRRVAISSDPATASILRDLADARLVVTSQDAVDGREIAEVAHEALIRNWRTLRAWIDEDREFLRTLARVEASANQWEREKREPSRLLAAGRALAEGEELLESRREELNANLVEFITASGNAVRARERRKVRTAGVIIAIMAALGLTAGGFAYLSIQARTDAEENLAIAREQLIRNERQAARVAAVQRIALDSAERAATEWENALGENIDVRNVFAVVDNMTALVAALDNQFWDVQAQLQDAGVSDTSVAAVTEYVAEVVVTEIARINDFAKPPASARQILGDDGMRRYEESYLRLRQNVFEFVGRQLGNACSLRAAEYGQVSAEMVECEILRIQVLIGLDPSQAMAQAEMLVATSRKLSGEPLLVADSLEILALALSKVGGEDALRNEVLDEAKMIRDSRRLD